VLVFALLMACLIIPRPASPGQRVVVLLLAVLVVAWVGFSRLYLGDHYPTDVLAGAALGLGWGTLVLTAVEWRAGHRRRGFLGEMWPQSLPGD
jgi:membrane-associated phospholipid phosphatase